MNIIKYLNSVQKIIYKTEIKNKITHVQTAPNSVE